jgi:hypothetical protein
MNFKIKLIKAPNILCEGEGGIRAEDEQITDAAFAVELESPKGGGCFRIK